MRSQGRICRIFRNIAAIAAVTFCSQVLAPPAKESADSGAAGTASKEATSPAKRPDLVGVVKAGESFPRATVFIFTAGPKVGTSTFCPSCYADCRKSAKTDERGAFKIESLDPELLFRILVVAKGYKPQFVTKVDPSSKPLAVELEPVASRAITPDRSIHGKVVNSEGKPIVGAVVESHGIRRKNDGGATWGSLPGVDPLAVTDENGEFLLTAAEPFYSLDVRVEAGTYANKQFSNLAGGATPHTLTLTEGVTVKGRVLRDGKPLPFVEVGMVSVDRGVENFTGNFDIGTDKEGRFAFVNLPPNVSYYVYGLMGTLKNHGTIPVRTVQTGADGTIVDAGDLVVDPSFRLEGKVVCADGNPIPPDTRLLISREQAWDSMQIELDKDGRFNTTGLPRETISLSVRISGYHISPRNLSLDSLNPFQLVGRVDHDVTNLVFLMESGPELRPQYDSMPSEADMPQNRPLHGAEGKPDHSGQWLLSGHVRDTRTGESLPRFQVTCGNLLGFMNRVSWDERNQGDGTNGEFLVYLSKRYAQPVLKVEAEGYLPKRFPVQPESRTNLDLQLEQGTGPSGTVLLPDGKPAQGVSLALLCEGEQEVSLDASGALRAWRHRELINITEPDGSFTLKPELDMSAVVVASKEGFAITPVSDLAKNPKIVLEAWGRLKGVLQRASHPSTNEPIDLALEGRSLLSLQLHTVTDSEGRFEFERVPPGRVQINGRNMVSANGWSWDPLEKVEVKPGSEVNVEIKAPAKSQQRADFAHGPPVARPKRLPGPGLQGTVLLPNGQPAVDAEVALLAPASFIGLGKATFKAYEARQDGLIVRADPTGHFALPLVEGGREIVAVHEQGFAEIEVAKFDSLSPIKLEPWGRVEGTLRVGRRLGTNELVLIESEPPMSGEPRLTFDNQDFQARTDSAGKFMINFVPPGERLLARMIPTGIGSWQHSAPTIVTVKPGATTAVTVGGTGRTVLGKIHVPQPDFTWTNVHGSLHLPLPAAFTQPGSAEEQAKWSTSPAAKLAMKNYRAYPVEISSDGSFRVEEVLAGKYVMDLMVMAGNGSPDMRMVNHFRCELVVPEPSGKDDPSPADLGIVEAKLKPIDSSRNKF